MKRYVTRSVTARIQRVAEPQRDSEFIKGEITTTGLGVHLRWEYPDAETLTTDNAAADSSSVPSTPSYSHVLSASAVTPLSAASSRASIASARTLLSSDEDEQGDDSRPQTPIHDERCDTGSVAPTPTTTPRRLQRGVRHSDVQPSIWGGEIADAEHAQSLQAAVLEQRQKEYTIHLEQLRKLEAAKQIKEARWAEAQAAGIFDDDEEEEEDQESETSDETKEREGRSAAGGDVRMGNPIAPGGFQSSLVRSDTWMCDTQEPPSRMRPTLSQPRLPYIRPRENLSNYQHASTSTTTHRWGRVEGSNISTQSSTHSTSTSISVPSQFSRCVRRYQENGVWKTAGSFTDLPVLAHLAAYDSQQSIENPQPRPTSSLSHKSSRQSFFVAPQSSGAWPASLSQQSILTDLDEPASRPVGLNRRLHRSM